MDKNKVIIISVAVMIFILSAGLGFLLIDSKNNYTAEEPPHQSPDISLNEIIENEPVSETFKIQLSGTTLEMLQGDNIIKSTEIAPDVYPYIDIEELRVGTVYSTYEDALMDWEGLSD